jgi:competence protein ComEA
MKILTMVIFGISLLLGAVDINTADVKELSELNGIGAKKADDIVKYRTTNCFNNVDELVKVKGIGKKILERNRDNLTASKCKK